MYRVSGYVSCCVLFVWWFLLCLFVDFLLFHFIHRSIISWSLLLLSCFSKHCELIVLCILCIDCYPFGVCRFQFSADIDQAVWVCFCFTLFVSTCLLLLCNTLSVVLFVCGLNYCVWRTSHSFCYTMLLIAVVFLSVLLSLRVISFSPSHLSVFQ